MFLLKDFYIQDTEMFLFLMNMDHLILQLALLIFTSSETMATNFLSILPAI